MGVKKGTNNFEQYQKGNVEFVKARIVAHLGVLEKSKARFDSPSRLIDYLCPRITEDLITRWKEGGEKDKEPKPIAKATLYRNESYRVKVDCFIAGLPLVGGTDTALVKTSLPVAQAKVFELQLEASNLKKQVKTLEWYIENQGVSTDENELKKIHAENNDGNDFAQTAQSLLLLVDASEGQFEVDTQGQIIATHKMINNVVVNKNTLAPFLRWRGEQGESYD